MILSRVASYKRCQQRKLSMARVQSSVKHPHYCTACNDQRPEEDVASTADPLKLLHMWSVSCSCGAYAMLQELIYTNKLADEEEDLLEAILQLGKALPRYNAYLLAPPAPAASAAKQQQAPTRQLALTGEQLHPRSLLAAGTLPLTYLHTPGSEDDLKGISHWVIADLDSQVRESLPKLLGSCVQAALAAALAFTAGTVGEVRRWGRFDLLR